MDIQTAKQIKIADYLHSLGFSPVKQQGINLWYKSPLREETEASFKVNTERNQWYDFALGKGGNSSHWHRNFIVPTMCLTSCKKSKNRHPVFAPCLFLLASNHLPSQVFNNWRLYRFLLLPCLLICRKGE